jgi:diaminohydroxyphosphoribosylaminopyrimidine deaminase/5-amino-6-(5-phosphoribosylamino)uracil reductase
MPASVRVEASADERWMSVALDLARRGRPAPNPPVGAVVVRGGLAVGRGWHYRAGGAHAEVVAIAAAGRLARLATLYVTLEPCNHYGRTAPCVDAIVAAGLVRVVVACIDPNPDVAGGGVERLRSCGIDVSVGLLEEDGARLIAHWAAAFEPARGPIGDPSIPRM